MGQVYVQTTGNAANSGSSDNNTADLAGAAATSSTTTITLDGSPDLSGVATSGANQASIALANATNSNRKIFWITAVDNGAKTVTVDVAPTGVGASPTAWKIGGRMVWTPANVEAALRAGDVVTFNDTPATRTTTYITARTSGTSAGGFIKVVGKSGVRPKLNVTNTSVVLTGNGFPLWWVENLELDQDGASGNVVSGFDTGCVFYNVKISDGGADGFVIGAAGNAVVNCEITGVLGAGINTGVLNNGVIFGNYIHDNGGNAISMAGTVPAWTIAYNILDTNAGKGILLSGAASAAAHRIAILNNTIYGNGDSGLEISDADMQVLLQGNIFQDNGNAAGEFNVEWAAGAAENNSIHFYNCFYHQGGGGGANLSGLTANATEIITDPLFTNPSGGDFSLGTTSPAKAAAFPGQLLGGNLGYLDMGAVQRQEPSSGGGILSNTAMDGGMN